MKRTFAHRVTAAPVALTVVLAGVALYCFVQRETAATLCGVLAMMVAVAVVERTVHTEYVLTSGGELQVSRGRFARRLVVRVAEITRMDIRPTLLHLADHVLIEYGAEHTVAVQPADKEHFIDELRKIQRKYDEKENIWTGGCPDDGAADDGTTD